MAIYKNVCIIDDDDLFLILSRAIMDDEGFADQIHDFEDASKALHYLKVTDSGNYPSVIFLDINMSLMDGWEFIEELGKYELKNNLKIYMTSSSINPADLEKAEGHPLIAGFISKPLDSEKLNKIAKSTQP